MVSVTESFVLWLRAKGYRASTRPPEDAPDAPSEFVTVERTGGAVRDLIDHPQMAVQAWAATEPRAEEMANDIRLLLLTGERPANVTAVSVEAGPYEFYDRETMCPRYQLMLNCAAYMV